MPLLSTGNFSGYPVYIGCWSDENSFGDSRQYMPGSPGVNLMELRALALSSGMGYMAMARNAADGGHAFIFNNTPTGVSLTVAACIIACSDVPGSSCGCADNYNGTGCIR
jgi:hypothetical protein